MDGQGGEDEGQADVPSSSVRPSARVHISQLTYGNVFPRCSREQREGGEEREGRWAVGGNGRGGARETGHREMTREGDLTVK